MNYQQSIQQTTSLIPTETTAIQKGPTGMVLVNPNASSCDYMKTDLEKSVGNVSFPEVDMAFILQRPVQIKTVTWTTVLTPKMNLFKITTADILGVTSLKQILQFQTFYRFDTRLDVMVASASSSTGALLIYWVPGDYNVPSPGVADQECATMLEHVFLHPYKQSSATLMGRFMRPLRYNRFDATVLGTFYCDIWNILGGVSATPAANSVQVTAYISFANVSMKLPRAIGTTEQDATTLTEKQKRTLKMTLTQEDYRKIQSVLNNGETDSEFEVLSTEPVMCSGKEEHEIELKVYKVTEYTGDNDPCVVLEQEPERCGNVDPESDEVKGGEITATKTDELPTVVDVDTSLEKLTVFSKEREPPVIGGLNTNYRGFLPVNHSDMKLSLQRFYPLITIPTKNPKFLNVIPNWKILFKISAVDMVKCIKNANLYYGYSGGLRVKIVHNGSKFMSAIMRVISFGCVTEYNVWKEPEFTLTLPYWERIPVYPLWANATDIPIPQNYLEIYIKGNVLENFFIDIWFGTADDFTLQLPMPGVKLADQRWSGQRVVYEGEPAEEVERCGKEEKKKKGGGMFTTVVDTLAEIVKFGGSLLGFYDRPDAPARDEWNVVDQPVPTVRHQFCDADYVGGDSSISCDTRGLKMMDLKTLFQIPLRVKVQDWTTSQTPGTVLFGIDVGLTAHKLFGYLAGIPGFWRGSCTLKFEFNKNVFHKGTVVAYFVPFGQSVGTGNYSQYYNLIFDISGKEAFEFTVPFSAAHDYLGKDQITGIVNFAIVNALAAQNTALTVQVNVYLNFEEDLELRIPWWPTAGQTADLAKTAAAAGPYAVTEPRAVATKKKVGIVHSGKKGKAAARPHVSIEESDSDPERCGLIDDDNKGYEASVKVPVEVTKGKNITGSKENFSRKEKRTKTKTILNGEVFETETTTRAILPTRFNGIPSDLVVEGNLKRDAQLDEDRIGSWKNPIEAIVNPPGKIYGLCRREGKLIADRAWEDRRTNCQTRNRVQRTIVDARPYNGKKLNVVTVRALDDVVYTHVHNQDTCLRCRMPIEFTDVQLYETTLAVLSEQPNIQEVKVTVDSKPRSYTNADIRIKNIGKRRFVVVATPVGPLCADLKGRPIWRVVDAILRQAGFRFESGNLGKVSEDDLPERCGGLLTKAGVSAGEKLAEKLDVGGIKTQVGEFLNKFGQKVDEKTKDFIDTLIFACLAKLPAYLLQISSVTDVKGYVSILLHLVGDLIMATQTYEKVKELLSALAEGMFDLIVNISTPIQCSDDKDAEENWLKALWTTACGIIKPFVDSGSLYFGRFVKFVSPIGVLGLAVRGLTAITDFLRKILNWFGICLTDKQRKMKAAKRLLTEKAKEYTEDIDSMKRYIVKGNPHAVVSDAKRFEEIRALGLRALNWKQQLACVENEEGVKGDMQIVQNFLHKVRELPNDPLALSGFEPMFIMLEGDPGLGKSTLSVRLAKMFAEVLCGDETQYYRVTMGQEYWTGCADQQVYIIDDLFQDPTGQGVSQLTQLISCVGFATPKADISGKFGFSQAKIVIGTSNSREPTQGSLTDKRALIRRYKDNHFNLDERGWRQVFYKEDGTVDYSSYLSEEEVSVRVQQKFRYKWAKHQELCAKPALKPMEETRKMFRSEREKVVRQHKEQTGEACYSEQVSNLTYSGSKLKQVAGSVTSEEDEFYDDESVPERRGKMDLHFKDGTVIDPKTTRGALFYDKIAELDDDDLEEYVEDETTYTQKVRTMNGKLEMLSVPYRVQSTRPLLVTGNLSDFKNWKYTGDMSDNRDVLCLNLAYEMRVDEHVMSTLLSRMVKKPTGRILKIVEGIKKQIWTRKVCIGTLGVVGALAAAAGVMHYMNGCTESGAYDTRANRIPIVGRFIQPKQNPQRAGGEDARRLIEKSILGWTMIGPSGKSVNMHCLSIGQGYVLVTKHGVRIGCQHYITSYDGGVERKIPVHLTEVNCVDFMCGENDTQDICLVWIGSAIPLRKSIVGHFVTQAQMDVLNHTAATLFVRHGHNLESRTGNVHWTDNQVIRATSLGERIVQSCFTGKIQVEKGDCGSPICLEGTGLSGRIFGIASAGSPTLGVFLPVTKEALVLAMDYLCTVVKDSQVEFCGSATTDLLDWRGGNVIANYELKMVGDEVELPLENPQFTALNGLEDQKVRLGFKSKIRETPVNRVLMGEPCKASALDNMEKSRVKIQLDRGGYGDATLLEKVVPTPNFDSGRLDRAVGIVSKILDFIEPCELLSEEEILNNYSRLDFENDLELNSNGVNTTSVSGYQLDKEYGKKPRGFWVTEVTELNVRHYGKELKDCIDKLESSLKEGDIPDAIVQMHYKDELRMKEKTDAGRCRIFYVADFAVWCLQKKYFGDFITKYRAGMGFKAKHAIGCDVVKWFDGWGQQFAGRPVISTDVKGWDTSVSGWHLELVRCLVEENYPNSTSEDRMVRKCLFDMIAWTHCLLGDKHYVATGVKSGMFATAEFNSLIHTIVIVYCLMNILPTVEAVRKWKFLTLGDDGAISLPDETEETLNAIKVGYEEMGFEMTGGDKGDVVQGTIDELVFLKRKFRRVKTGLENHFVPEMDYATVQSLVYFHRKGVSPIENAINALVFARQGMNGDLFGRINYTMASFPGWRMLSWNEVGLMYEGADFEAKLDIPEWEWLAGRGVTRLQQPYYIIGRQAMLDQLKVKVTPNEVCNALEMGQTYIMIHLCRMSGLELPFVWVMKRMLEEEGIYYHGDTFQVCCLWWYFCWYTECADPQRYLLMSPPVLTTDRLNQTKKVLLNSDLAHFTRDTPKSIRVICAELINSFPCNNKMAWWSILHMVHMWKLEDDGLDVCFWLFDLLEMSGFSSSVTTDLVEEYNFKPVRLPLTERQELDVIDDDPFAKMERLFDCHGTIFEEKRHFQQRIIGKVENFSRLHRVLDDENPINYDLTFVQ